MENRTHAPVVPLIAALFAVTAVAAVVWVALSTEHDQVEPNTLEPPGTLVVSGSSNSAGDQVPRQRTASSRQSVAHSDLSRVSGNETVVDHAPEEAPPSSPDAGQDVSRETLESWTASPVVKVGPQRWLPDVPPEREAEITAILEAPMAERELWLDVRRQSIDVFKVHAGRCFESLQQRMPDARGRFIAVWEVEGDGQTGRAHSVRLGPVVDLKEEAFLECVTLVRFPVWPTTAVFASVIVEHPLMFP